MQATLCNAMIEKYLLSKGIRRHRHLIAAFLVRVHYVYPSALSSSQTTYMDLKVDESLLRACSLARKFEHGGETKYIGGAVVLDREALSLCPPGHPMRSCALVQLAKHLWHRCNRLGGIDDLHEAIDLGREALVLHPPGHPDRSISLSNLALHLSTRYIRLGGINDLHEAIVLGRSSLALRHEGHPERPTSLNNLAAQLSIRYNRFGGIDDLDEAIVLSRNAILLYPSEHPIRPMALNNLSNQLSSRYGQLGGIDDLNEAIDLARDALASCPPGHAVRLPSLNNLAAHLSMRYNQLGGIDDLNEAIVLTRDGLALCATRHPDRSTSLNALAVLLSIRYDRLEEINDLNEAVILGRDVLACRPPGYHESMPLSNLACYLWKFYQQLRRIDDLDEAIQFDRTALTFRPLGHPDRSESLSNLCLHLATRYVQVRDIDDLDEAIVHGRDALALRPPGHTGRSTSLEYLAGCLRIRFTLQGQVEDREEVFCLYAELEDVTQTVSSSDLSAANAWVSAAEEFHHPTTLLAYETALRLLVRHLAALPSLPQNLGILKLLSSSLAVDAFSACVRNQSPTVGVELLEQGRGVFWAQLTRLRSPLDDVIASGLAGKVLGDEFTHLTLLARNALNSLGADQHDRVCRLNVKVEGVVSKIRALPGLSRFLLPSFFSDLQCVASDGPVIIVNPSKYSCDALIVFADRDPAHISLSVTKEDIRVLSSRLRTSTELAKRLDVTRDLGIILRELWDRVVSPIVDVLRTTHPLQSRVWWCPTAEFSLFPLHAAGPYRKGRRNFSDLYISSYTPTLAALIRARRPSSTNPTTQQKRFIAIGQANASGTDKLPFVGPELANIGRLIDGVATFTCIQGHESSISRVANELGKHAWVHLACHGIPNRKQPLESAFALHDGRFTIQRILQCELENPEFAYLSACHTTVGDEESPDEAIHLASAMQFAGFRSVIGTMWAVDDAHTDKVTSVFYRHMIDESGRLDHTRAAFALWKTMRSLNMPIDQRILYIHLGA